MKIFSSPFFFDGSDAAAGRRPSYIRDKGQTDAKFHSEVRMIDKQLRRHRETTHRSHLQYCNILVIIR